MKNDKPEVQVENKKKKRAGTTKGMLFMRLLVGCAVMYYAYTLIPAIEESKGKESIFFLVAAIFLGVAGLMVVFASAIRIKNGEYSDDNGNEEEEDIHMNSDSAFDSSFEAEEKALEQKDEKDEKDEEDKE